LIESGGDGSIELVELSQPFFRHESISTIRMEEACGKGRVDLVKQFEEQQTDAIAVWQEMIAAGMWELFNQAFGAEL
jgi:hypothetical protein